ncbi:MAG: transcriptional regulator [Anaerolineales bacterium]|nr:transcriptional regulator [Anaerolineales bacterium]
MLYTEEHYTQALETLDNLLEIVGEDENHPFYELLDTLGIMIAAYEEIHHSVDDVVSRDVLRFLMDEHHLTLSFLPELGVPETVSEILIGKHKLNVTQIRALSEHFGLSPVTFL